MDKGLIKINWEEIEKYSDEDISYFLYLEGKSVDAICRIRNLDKVKVQEHLINGKIKYRFLVKSKNSKELFETISKAGKQDKVSLIRGLDLNTKEKLVKYIRENYGEMLSKDKESAVWILGEIKEVQNLNILLKASVHKHVNIRRMAVSAMGKIGDMAIEIPLIRALDDENSQVVLYALKALSKLNTTKAIDKVKKIYENTDKEYLKNAAKELLLKSNIDSE